MNKKKRSVSKESAVSETVGYIIIFGIMMTGIGLVTLYGYPLLLQEQANANIRNMERNMIVLQSDINGLTYKNVPYQETTLQVSGGTLMVENPSDKKYFEIINGTGGSVIPTGDNTFQTGQLLYISSSEPLQIGLQNGAVVKWQLGGSVMLSEPRWFFDEDTGTLVITLIQIRSNNQMAETGIGTVSMNISQLYQPYEETSPGLVTIRYTDAQSDYFSAWRNYFTKFAPTPTGEVTISGVNKLIIKMYRVTVLSL